MDARDLNAAARAHRSTGTYLNVDSEADGDRRIEVAAGDAANGVSHGEHSQPER